MPGAFQLPNPQQGAIAQPPQAVNQQAQPKGLIAPGNLDPFKKAPSSSSGTLASSLTFPVATEQGQVLVPQMVKGQLLTKREAIAHFMKTGQHLGIFDSPENATAYADSLHSAQTNQIKSASQGAFQDQKDFEPSRRLPAGPLSKDGIEAVNKKYR
jgi:hypothetical protein